MKMQGAPTVAKVLEIRINPGMTSAMPDSVVPRYKLAQMIGVSLGREWIQREKEPRRHILVGARVRALA